MAGDEFHNHGVNYGHIGPLTITKGKPIQWLPTYLDEALALCQVDEPVTVKAVGGLNALDIGRALQDHLAFHNFEVELRHIGVIHPAPTHPFSFARQGKKLIFVIAPEI